MSDEEDTQEFDWAIDLPDEGDEAPVWTSRVENGVMIHEYQEKPQRKKQS